MVCVALWEGRETSAECRVTKDWADELKREWGGGWKADVRTACFISSLQSFHDRVRRRFKGLKTASTTPDSPGFSFCLLLTATSYITENLNPQEHTGTRM